MVGVLQLLFYSWQMFFGGTATVPEQQQHETMQSKVGVLI